MDTEIQFRDQKTKDEIYEAVFYSVVRLDIQKGHLAWTITDLARASEISRPLIYYYFGKSKETIMSTAVDYLGERFFGLSPDRIKMWQEGKIVESVLASRNLCQNSPFVFIFYMMRRTLQTDIGEKLRLVEARYKEKILQHCPNLQTELADALAAVLFGLVCVPDLTDQAIKNAIMVVQSTLPFVPRNSGN